MKTIAKAIKYFGSQSKMAKEINVRPDQIHKWMIKIRFPSAKSAIAIENKTNGKVRAEDIFKESVKIKSKLWMIKLLDKSLIEKKLKVARKIKKEKD